MTRTRNKRVNRFTGPLTDVRLDDIERLARAGGGIGKQNALLLIKTVRRYRRALEAIAGNHPWGKDEPGVASIGTLERLAQDALDETSDDRRTTDE